MCNWGTELPTWIILTSLDGNSPMCWTAQDWEVDLCFVHVLRQFGESQGIFVMQKKLKLLSQRRLFCGFPIPPTSAQIHSPGTSIHVPTHRIWCYRFFVALKTSTVHLHILNYVSKEMRSAVSPSLASLTLNLQANTFSITCFMPDVDGITMNPAPK